MQAHQSFIFAIALSSPQICRPESFTGGPLCVCVCPSAPDSTDHLDHHSRPEQNRPWPSRRPSIHRLTVFLAAFLSRATAFARACPRMSATRLKEHVHVSSPVKVTPYASCRDNEGFNFTTQAYQIAAPRSPRHALAT